jgi:hypothetical protein
MFYRERAEVRSAPLRSSMVIAGLMLLTVLMLVPISSSAQDPYAGKLKSYQSEKPSDHVKALRLGYSGMLVVNPGDPLFIGDTIKTGAGVKAQIELSDKTLITLAPLSNLQIKGLLLDREQGKRNSVLRALKGTIRFVVAKLFRQTPGGTESAWKDSQVTIETLNAVAGVRGTDFFCITEADSSEFAVVDGVVNVRSSTLSQRGDVPLGANQSSLVRRGGNPSPPMALSADRLESLTKSTAIDNPMTVSNGGNGATQKRPVYDEKDVARDLAAGLALADILDRAVEAGMIIEDAVKAALDAGAPPSGVVYTAIAVIDCSLGGNCRRRRQDGDHNRCLRRWGASGGCCEYDVHGVFIGNIVRRIRADRGCSGNRISC